VIPLHDNIPARHPPLMMWALLSLNVFIFMFELSLPNQTLEAFFYHFGIVPARFGQPARSEWILFRARCYLPFITSMFLHGGWVHLISNMWVLWIFGDNVEDRMGHWRFFVFYLLCGLIAGIVHSVTNSRSAIPTIGASGAIAGVLGAYFAMFPRARITVLLPIFIFPLIFTLPAALYILIWFLMQFLSGVASLAGPGQVGGVAWWAHVGGCAGGIMLYRLFLRPEGKWRLSIPF